MGLMEVFKLQMEDSVNLKTCPYKTYNMKYREQRLNKLSRI